jgi:Zn ribbon nucleic-acid-binding protein
MEKQTKQVWECNSCGFRDYTDAVSEDDVELLACSNCGNDEFHLVKQRKKTNAEHYSVLNTTLNVDSWWDSLTEKERIDVGGVAIHFSLISANFKWSIRLGYSQLKNSQKGIVKQIYNRRNEQYSMFPKGSYVTRI